MENILHYFFLELKRDQDRVKVFCRKKSRLCKTARFYEVENKSSTKPRI